MTTFPYRTCVDWLRDQARQLEGVGQSIEVLQNEAQLPTFNLKVTADAILADLVVWEYGRASMQVFDLTLNKHTLEQHDVELSANDYQRELGVFFEAVRPRT